jgi:hypothetical protein
VRIESHSTPAPRINSAQEWAPERREDTAQVPVAEPVEQNPALRAYLGESAFEPAAEKVQAKEEAPKIDPALFGGWAGERLQLGLLIAENIKHSTQV